MDRSDPYIGSAFRQTDWSVYIRLQILIWSSSFQPFERKIESDRRISRRKIFATSAGQVLEITRMLHRIEEYKEGNWALSV
jgi:hypothetical protein